MVIFGFGQQGHLCHESKGLHEAVELQIAVQPVSVHNPIGQGCAECRLLGGIERFNWHGSPELPLHRGWSRLSVAQVMQSINHQIGVGIDAVVGFPGVGVVSGLNGLIDPFAIAQAQQGLRRG